LALALAAQVVATWALVAWWGPMADLALVGGLANLGALGLAVWVGCRWTGERPRFRPPVPTDPGLVLALALTAAGATVVLGEAANWAGALVPVPPAVARLFNELTDGPPAVSLFTLALVAPLTEEALFRGLLLPGFARRWGVGPALVLSSALFGLFHLNIWQAPAAFVAGLYLGWLALATGSLLYPMAAHALFNGLPVVLSTLGWRVEGFNTPLVPGHLSFQPWPWTLAGALVLGAGLVLTRRWMPKPWAPLSPTAVSDRVQP